MTNRRAFALLSLALTPGVVACSASPDEAAIGQQTNAIVTDTGLNGDRLPPNTLVLTYDDGPDEHTIEIAKYLWEQKIQATFFMNGRRFCKSDGRGGCALPMETRACDNGGSQAFVANPIYYPESLIDTVLSYGHRVANHTEDHCDLTGQTSGADVSYELRTTQAILDRHANAGSRYFRPPYGDWNAGTASFARTDPSLDSLIGPVFWDINGNDWSCWLNGVSVAVCEQGYVDLVHARPWRNGIIIMHDRPEFNVGYAGPLLLTQMLVPQLLAEGYGFGTLDDIPRDECPAQSNGTFCAGGTMTCHNGTCREAFEDVAPGSTYHDFIVDMLRRGITGGCSYDAATGNRWYCPESAHARSEIAVFVVRARNLALPDRAHGLLGGSPDQFLCRTAFGTYESCNSGNVPQYFDDVPPGHWAYQWIQKLAELGITTGCGVRRFCPDSTTLLDDSTVFVERAIYGCNSDLACDGAIDFPSSPLFSDVSDPGNWRFRYIQNSGFHGRWCGKADGSGFPFGRYGVADAITRRQMSALIERGLFGGARCWAPEL